MDKQEYDKAFDGEMPSRKDRAEKALDIALDIRKFEIELYWKRATYFWTFIAAAFAGYALVYTRAAGDNSWILLVFSCLGFLFSVAWYLVNRGSKFWQNNWERHVDLLEDKVVGPLYKTIAHGPRNHGHTWLTAASEYSVTKINQILSFFVSMFWLVLIVKSVWPISAPLLDVFKIAALLITFLAVVCLFCLGKSDNDETKTMLRSRRVTVEPCEKGEEGAPMP